MRQMNVLSREPATAGADAHAPKIRILILGGGFGGVYTARHLEKLCRRRPDVEIVLVSRDNFLVMTPLLFEVCSGTLDLRGRRQSFSFRVIHLLLRDQSRLGFGNAI